MCHLARLKHTHHHPLSSVRRTASLLSKLHQARRLVRVRTGSISVSTVAVTPAQPRRRRSAQPSRSRPPAQLHDVDVRHAHQRRRYQGPLEDRHRPARRAARLCHALRPRRVGAAHVSAPAGAKGLLRRPRHASSSNREPHSHNALGPGLQCRAVRSTMDLQCLDHVLW